MKEMAAFKFMVLFLLAKQLQADQLGNSHFVGGQIAAPNQFRGFVSLHGSHKGCAGTLIELPRTNQSVVVTSACCIPEDLIRISKLRVSAEYTTENESLTTRMRVIRHVSKVIVHPDYRNRFANNIALLILREPFKYTSTFGPVKLLGQPFDNGANCAVAGWGPSGQLTYTYVNVVPIKRYRDDGCYQNYDKNLVIAHDEYGQSGPSLNDTGTGLICDDKLAGILNFISYCELTEGKMFILSYYSAVHRYIDFIEMNGSYAPTSKLSSILTILLIPLIWSYWGLH